MEQESPKPHWWARITPAGWALLTVAAATWTVSATLFLGFVNHVQAEIDAAALDGTAFTLLSAMVAMWTGFGVWAGRQKERAQYLWISLSALGGVVIATGAAMIWMAVFDKPFAIPSNVAQLLILVTSALISIVGASVGYTPGGPGLPPDPPPEE